MNQVDLELYRWKWHNLSRKKPQKFEHMVMYWKEYGAFISILPRQSGKSSRMIKTMFDELYNKNDTSPNVIVVAINSTMALHLESILNVKNIVKPLIDISLFCRNIDAKHLLIDEFCYIPDHYLNSLLSHNWESVSMVSTLR